MNDGKTIKCPFCIEQPEIPVKIDLKIINLIQAINIKYEEIIEELKDKAI